MRGVANAHVKMCWDAMPYECDVWNCVIPHSVDLIVAMSGL